MSEQTKEPTTPTTPIRTKFMQSETCAQSFRWLSLTFILFITFPGQLGNNWLTVLPILIGLIVMTWIMHRIVRLSSSARTIRNISFVATILYSMPFVGLILYMCGVNFDFNEAISHIFFVWVILDLITIWKLLSLIKDMAIVAANQKLYESAHRTRVVYFLTAILPIVIGIAVGLGLDSLMSNAHNPLGELKHIFAVGFISYSVIKLILIISMMLLFKNTAKMCRTFSTQQSPPQPEAQNV